MQLEAVFQEKRKTFILSPWKGREGKVRGRMKLI